MSARMIDWIWHVRGSLALAPGQSSDEAFDRLDPLFRQPGTRSDRAADTLTFHKSDQAAQDKMSIFDGGTLRVERSIAGPVLRYHLTSRALLFCFLAPLLFLAIAQATVAINAIYAPGTGPAAKLAKAKAEAKQKAMAKQMAAIPMNPIDKALGAPAPEKPSKKDKETAKKTDRKPTTTAAYVFAAIFATLYVVGRILEDRLIRSLFKRKMTGA